LSNRFGIKAFPTIRFFENGKDEDYTGGRNFDAIVSWHLERTGQSTGSSFQGEEAQDDPSVLTLNDHNFDIDAFEHLAIEFYAPWC